MQVNRSVLFVNHLEMLVSSVRNYYYYYYNTIVIIIISIFR